MVFILLASALLFHMKIILFNFLRMIKPIRYFSIQTSQIQTVVVGSAVLIARNLLYQVCCIEKKFYKPLSWRPFSTKTSQKIIDKVDI